MNCSRRRRRRRRALPALLALHGPEGAKKRTSACATSSACRSTMVQYLDDYNQISSKPMKLVLFLFAVEHVCSIARVLQMPRGNALLAASAARAASRSRGSRPHLGHGRLQDRGVQVLLDDRLARGPQDGAAHGGRAGQADRLPLRRHRRSRSEAYLEDINGLLNAGEVPNLFADDEKAQICDSVRDVARKRARGRRLADHAVRLLCRPLPRAAAHLPRHVAHRRRLPHAAAHVPLARQLLHHRLVPPVAAGRARRRGVDLPRGGRDGEARPAVTVEMCKIFHESVRELSRQVPHAERREVYVTPTSYLELIQTFQTLLARKRKEIDWSASALRQRPAAARDGGRGGRGMQEELTSCKPELSSAKEETEEMQVASTRRSRRSSSRRRRSSPRRRRPSARWPRRPRR